jgi:DNA-binding transcriptional ArsR family regulator
MARSASTLDAFTAIAEPRRRELLEALSRCRGERDVTWLVQHLGWPQPVVSKHLGVLRQVGLVHVVRRGRRRVYTLNGTQLRPVYDWARSFEQHWAHQLLRVKARAEQLERGAQAPTRPSTHPRGRTP